MHLSEILETYGHRGEVVDKKLWNFRKSKADLISRYTCPDIDNFQGIFSKINICPPSCPSHIHLHPNLPTSFLSHRNKKIPKEKGGFKAKKSLRARALKL